MLSAASHEREDKMTLDDRCRSAAKPPDSGPSLTEFLVLWVLAFLGIVAAMRAIIAATASQFIG
jgi:hypothetical protein